MIESIMDRLKKRLGSEEYNTDLLEELAQEIIDRLCLRLGVEEGTFPSRFGSIVVDATVKLYQRVNFEGMSSVNALNVSMSYVDDVLAEYADEIKAFVNNGSATDGSTSANKRRIRFL